MANYIYFSETDDGHKNLALDEWFLDHVAEDDLILYFYVNANAVIIGKNQNPWKECAAEKMKEDGVQLVRRISGGGAVYHDSGNLNFSFNAGKERFDKEKQHRFILETVQSLGIPCEFSGRNDLLCMGKKFSGNAYCSRGKASQHHGTLLVSSDLSRLSRYLTVDERKMRAKGVSSVRARVCNLCDVKPFLTVDELKRVIPTAFEKVYGAWKSFVFDEASLASLRPYREKHASDAWIYGQTPDFDYEIDERFSFGGVQILLNLKNGRIFHSKTYTDANDETLSARLDALLEGAAFSSEEISKRLRKDDDACLSEIALFIEKSL